MPASKLLIDENPLQVLPSLAVKIGLNEAIFLQQLHFWLTPSPKYKPHYREWQGDMLPWIYNTYDEKTTQDGKLTGWAANFPFWSTRTIMRIVASLKERGLIIVTDKFNDSPANRTLWYTVDYSKVKELEGDDKMAMSSMTDCQGQDDNLSGSRGCQVGSLMTETTTESTTDGAAAKNAAANLDEWFPESTHNGHKPKEESLLAQIQNGSTEQANKARLIALGLSAKEQAPTTGLEQIELANWRIKDDRIRQGVAVFLEAVPLGVPVSPTERGQWQKGIKDHLEEFGLTGLKELYHTAWNEYLPDITAGKLDITHPLALTRKMRGIRSRPQPTTQEAKYFIDPDTGERIKW